MKVEGFDTWYSLPVYAYNWYRANIRNGEGVSHELAEKMINRDIKLSLCLLDGHTHSLYLFDDMMIKCKKDNKGARIVSLYKDREPDKKMEWELHRKKYSKLNKRLGIPMEV